MSDETHWGIIGRSRGAARGGLLARLLGKGGGEEGKERQLDAIRSDLERLTADEIAGFQIWLHEQMQRANRWDLWGAAYVMCGGCSDDGFEYFRAWLIAQGRGVFERVLADPESLADLRVAEPEEECEFEALLYVSAEVYGQKTGRDLYEALPERVAVDGPRGEPFDEESVFELYPRLAARWGG
jgi:hypothetical protein